MKTSPLLKVINAIGLSLLILIFATPFVWMVSTSLKTLGETLTFPPVWVPEQLMWSNFVEAWTSVPFLKYLINSIIVAVIILIIQFATMIPAAYAFARYKFKFKGFLFGITMITLMIPGQLIFLPLYLSMSSWGILDTIWALILPFGASAFGIFLLRQTFMQVPEELLEAARLDNALEWQIIRRIMIPMAKPTLITLAMFSFIAHWNDYFWPLVMTTTDTARTLPLGIAMLREVEGVSSWHIVMAGNVILVIPILIVFFIAQRHIIKAFVYNGVK
ncbi:Carbohydrate ABC transporter membrane protein 2 (CUT1 family) OS=Ureibacillus acetophenoni OX=614649 GN=SAMN05877842_12213 PE=3 SV=1 [Ureibacillus acetophenoni]